MYRKCTAQCTAGPETMAYIVKTPSNTFAVYRLVDGKQVKKTFKTKAEAVKFRALVELNPEQLSKKLTVREIMLRYMETETPKKKGYRSEEIRIKRLVERPFAQKALSDCSRKDMQRFVDTRASERATNTGAPISPATVNRECASLKSIFHWAVLQGMLKESPMRGVKLPRPPEHRERVASKEDIDRLLAAVAWDGVSPIRDLQQLVVASFLFACKTGMRSGEILRLQESWIKGRVATLPAEATKTASRRFVALSNEALRILDLVRAYRPETLFFMTDQERDVLFRRIRDRADLGPKKDSEGRVIEEGLNFHDSRATFCTWAASPDPKTGAPRLDVMALSRQTGHKDLKMLMRYYRASAAAIASRLDE